MKKINRKKSTKTENKKQKRRIIKVVCLIVAVMITSAGMYLGFGIFKQVEGFSKEKLTSDESSVLCTTDGEEWFSVARGGVQKNVSYNDIDVYKRQIWINTNSLNMRTLIILIK